MKAQACFTALVALFIVATQFSYGTIRYVGPGQPYATIQAAINASTAGDTVKVLPGVYNEAITITQNIVIQGSGYETTVITSSTNPTVTMSNGKIMWFAITSSGGNGVNCSGGSVTNCVISGCTGRGIFFPNPSTGSIKNCVIYGNALGVRGTGSAGFNYTGTASNCISWNNGGSGFSGLVAVTYSDGSLGDNANQSNNINLDPLFISSSDFRIDPTSPCWNTGNPADFDPDGSRSDMGYYGGFDAPVFPVVTDMRIILNTGGTVTVRAIGKSRF
jgi:hypothetical protein